MLTAVDHISNDCLACFCNSDVFFSEVLRTFHRHLKFGDDEYECPFPSRELSEVIIPYF